MIKRRIQVQFTGTQEQLNHIVEIQQVVTIAHWECDGAFAYLDPMFSDCDIMDVQELVYKHFNDAHFAMPMITC